jgi:ferritin-like metal-binding protein YciE
MAEVKTTEGLLVNALQDLHDAERAMAEKLPGIADDVSDLILRELLDEDAMRSTVHQRKVADLLKRRGAGVDGDPNIWLRAILDDAVRDTETVEKGALLDIALAEALDGDDAPTLAAIRDEEAASDLRLTSILAELTDGNKMETA